MTQTHFSSLGILRPPGKARETAYFFSRPLSLTWLRELSCGPLESRDIIIFSVFFPSQPLWFYTFLLDSISWSGLRVFWCGGFTLFVSIFSHTCLFFSIVFHFFQTLPHLFDPPSAKWMQRRRLPFVFESYIPPCSPPLLVIYKPVFTVVLSLFLRQASRSFYLLIFFLAPTFYPCGGHVRYPSLFSFLFFLAYVLRPRFSLSV